MWRFSAMGTGPLPQNIALAAGGWAGFSLRFSRSPSFSEEPMMSPTVRQNSSRLD